MKQIDQKKWAENIKKKQDQINYFRAEISQMEQKLVTLNKIKQNDF